MDLAFLGEHFEHTTTPLLRTDASDAAAWERVSTAVTAEVDFGGEYGEGGYVPNIEPIESPSLVGITPDALAAGWARAGHGYVLLADERTMREALPGVDPTLVYVDLASTEEDEAEFGWSYGRSFRVVASEVAGIEANLAIANMDFSEFADQADADGGVYRGFAE